MRSPDGSVWLVMNGEIYNFGELRSALEKRGHVFVSRSDTEVVIHAYLEHGSECVRDLDGMFALALWDGRNRRLLLARDKIGEKPLFYCDDGSRILFASEVAALLVDPTVIGKMDPKALRDYLELGYVGGERTMFSSIRRLPPATTMSVEGGSSRKSRYWSWAPHLLSPMDVSGRELEEHVASTFQDAVRSRMVSDVPIGAFLSGGLDSSAIVAAMAEISPVPIKTFSISFPGHPEDESTFARSTAAHFGTEHHELDLEPEDIRDVLSKVVAHFDDPFSDSSSLPTYYVSKLAKTFVTVVLSGDGGDEVFGGYERYRRMLREDLLFAHLRGSRSAPLMGYLGALSKVLGRGIGISRRIDLNADDRYGELMRQMDIETSNSLSPLRSDGEGLCGTDLVVHAMRDVSGADLGSRLQYADVATYLPDDILVKVDRMTMMTSLEARAPFLAPKLMELAARVPTKLRVGLIGQGKMILRNSMRKKLPRSILKRRKAGFGLPLNAWVRGNLNSYMTEVVSDRSWLDRGLLPRESIKRVLKRSRELGDQRPLWMMATLALWSSGRRIFA